MKATEQYFPVVLFNIMLCKAALTFVLIFLFFGVVCFTNFPPFTKSKRHLKVYRDIQKARESYSFLTLSLSRLCAYAIYPSEPTHNRNSKIPKISRMTLKALARVMF